MEVVSVKVDTDTKRRMNRLKDINWSEVLRQALRRRIDSEERLRSPIDRRRAAAAAHRMDEFRARVGPGEFDSTKEIRKSRDQHPRS
ncbi:MAG: hypothetical protein AABX97_02440 [Candidatus Thermoplasmatota archaeon]